MQPGGGDRERMVLRVLYEGPGLSGRTTSVEFLSRHFAGRVDAARLETHERRYADGGYHWARFAVRDDSLADGTGRDPWVEVVAFNSSRVVRGPHPWRVIGVPDAIVFVADSQEARADANGERLQRVRESLVEFGRNEKTTPWVFQYNKRDLAGSMSIEQLDASLNPERRERFGSVASRGEGVVDAFGAVIAGLKGRQAR